MNLRTFIEPTCPSIIPLVNGPVRVRVPTSYITASSVNTATLGTYQARFDSTEAWCPTRLERDAYPPNLYIQVSVNMIVHLLLPR